MAATKVRQRLEGQLESKVKAYRSRLDDKLIIVVHDDRVWEMKEGEVPVPVGDTKMYGAFKEGLARRIRKFSELDYKDLLQVHYLIS